MGATYGGGEANVAVSLANYGVDAAFVTKLPRHDIGQPRSTPCAATAWTPARSSAAATAWASHFLEKGRVTASLQGHLRPRTRPSPPRRRGGFLLGMHF